MPKKLLKKQLTTALRSLSAEWKLDESATHLVLTIPSRTYLTGFMLVTKVAIHAEVHRQYPTITLTEKRVKISLSTTAIKGISDADIKFAKQIDLIMLSTKK